MAHSPTTALPRALAPWMRTLLLMLALAASITLFTCGPCWSDPHEMMANFLFCLAFTVGLWLTNGFAVEWLNGYVSWKQQPVKRLILTLIVSLGGSLVVIFGLHFVYRVLYRGHDASVLLSAPVLRQLAFPIVITIICSLVMHSRAFLQGWREALVSNERLQKENAVSQYESLRKQVNPHFLFNSLNALTSLVEEDPKRAVRFIRQLSEVYRYVLDSQEQEVVSLAEELRFAESYLYLQRTRLGEGLDVAFDLPPAAALEQFMLPPLALQLLLENAIKHNATRTDQPLRIRVELDQAAQQVVVRNTLRPRRVSPEESTGLGLSNLQARYAFLSKQPVQIEQTATEFIVKLPVLEMVTA
ncbi:sensor histidine kinase [Hymenobacter jejuensis]|nr:sensor histidine kinase [Hymenobacter jejuensis]